MANNLFDSLEYIEENTEFEEETINYSSKWKKILFLLKAILYVGISYIIFSNSLGNNNEILFRDNELIISDLQQSIIISTLETELKTNIEKEDIEEYLVLNAIKTNEKLTQQEKSIFYKFISILKDNPYINKEKAYRSLNEVYIEYIERPDDVEVNILADYTDSLDRIRVFTDTPEQTEENPPENEVEHEGLHSIFDDSLPRWFKEGATELYCNEYYSQNPYVEYVTYPIEVSAVKLLCEVTTNEIILEAFTTGNFKLIENYIINLLDDENLVCESLELLGKSIDYKDDKTATSNIENNLRCLDIFDKCIEKKYEKDPDYQAIPYFYNRLLVASIFSEEYYTTYCNVIDSLGVLEKGYFSKELQEKEVKLVKTLR